MKFTHIVVGSRNPGKIRAVTELAALYPDLADAVVTFKEVPSGVSKQPRSLEETVQGARNRASAAISGLALGVGIESGVIEVGLSGTSRHFSRVMLDICACVLWPGSAEPAVGLSGAWMLSPELQRSIYNGRNLAEACLAVGISGDPALGDNIGAIGVLTEGRITRVDYTKQAVQMALVGLGVR